jgi:hypothetical protein
VRIQKLPRHWSSWASAESSNPVRRQSWKPLDGHIFLVLLATPVKVRPNIVPDSHRASTSSELSDSKRGTESQLETTKDEGAIHRGGIHNNHR